MKNSTTQKKRKSFLTKNTFFLNYAKTLLCVVFCFVSFDVKANEDYKTKFKSELTQIEDYLNNIKNLSSKFVQNSNGNLVEGTFFLSRNKTSSGKMRIEYSSQPKVIIVANGSVLSYYDVELDEISHLGTNTTPASLLTRPNISFFAKDVELTGVKKLDNQITVSLIKKNRKEAGEFSLTFSTDPLKFEKMEVKNDLDQVISVKLVKIDFTTPIPDKLFVIKNKKSELE